MRRRGDEEAPPRLTARLAERALGYLRISEGSVVVRLETVSHRPASRLYRFTIEAPTARRRIVVKQPLTRADASGADRPRLSALTPPPDKARFEYRALSAIHGSLSAVPDSRMVTVEPLDLFDDLGVVVVGFLEGYSLRHLFARALQRRPGARAALVEAMERTGAWLARFHELPLLGEEQRTNPQELATAARNFGQYLSTAGVLPGGAGTVDARVAAALHSIPEPWALGPAHGDMAMRNVLVTSGGAVGVLDVLGRWRVPVLHDLAYFVLSLQTPLIDRPWLRFLGGERLAHLAARAFLRGYYGSGYVPVQAIAAYESLLLLDRWSASTRGRPGHHWPPLTNRVQDAAYLSVLRRLLAVAESS